MLKLSSVIVFSDNPNKLVEFYKQVLQKDLAWSGGDFYGFMLDDEALIIGPHDKVHGRNMNPERIMFNLETEDVEKEFERIKSIIGAEVIAAVYNPVEDPSSKIATFADPDGNYFQIASPMKFTM